MVGCGAGLVLRLALGRAARLDARYVLLGGPAPGPEGEVEDVDEEGDGGGGAYGGPKEWDEKLYSRYVL